VRWILDPDQQALLEFTRALFAVRSATPALRRGPFLPSDAAGAEGLVWLNAHGSPMTPEDWSNPASHFLGMLIDGAEPFLLLLNGGGRSRAVTLPGRPAGSWAVLLDTAHEGARPAHDGLTLAPHSLALLRHSPEPPCA